MKKRVMFSILFIIILSTVYGEWFMNSEQIKASIQISDTFTLLKESDDGSISYVIANLSFFPKDDYRQEVERTEKAPEAKRSDDVLSFRWDAPQFRKYSFSVKSDITIKNTRNQIKEKADFPVKKLPEEVRKYTLPSETIDSDNIDVISTANMLAEGEDDLFIVVHKLAEWTKNSIEYNLSTITASASKSASWVLANKQGVCDEITNLFIAFARSLGIPARFISGIAYTEADIFTERWLPHGWAEVYFPGYGWVEYDVTYGEFGYIDPTHIKLKESLDATTPATTYNWLGRDADLKTDKINIKTELKRYSGKYDDNVDILLWPEKNEIGFNSYNIINARIRNRNNYYVSKELHLHRTEGMEIIGSITKNVVLKPYEEEIVSWITNVGNLIYGYSYTFPVSISDLENDSARSSFRALYDGTQFSYDEMLKIMELRKEESEKKYSKNISISCEIIKDEMYVFEKNKARCRLANKGNFFFHELNVCFDEECKKMELGIAQEKEVEFEFSEQDAGKKEKSIFVKSKDATTLALVSYNVLDKPKIIISNITYPPKVSFDDEFSIDLVLKRESFSNPKEVELSLYQKERKKSWSIGILNEDRKFLIDMRGRDLIGENNMMQLIVDYKDNYGNLYSTKENINIALEDLTIFQKMVIFTNRLSTRKDVPFFIVAIITFLMIHIVLSGKRRKWKRKKGQHGSEL